jgi:hypothetical protein
MKYMLQMYTDEKAWTDDEREHCFAESTELTHDLHARGSFWEPRRSSPWHWPSACGCARASGWLPTARLPRREQLGGYFLVDAKDLNEAISIAARIPGARKGTVEVRPMMDLAGLPAAGNRTTKPTTRNSFHENPFGATTHAT